jgi:hypothetical protein
MRSHLITLFTFFAIVALLKMHNESIFVPSLFCFLHQTGHSPLPHTPTVDGQDGWSSTLIEGGNTLNNVSINASDTAFVAKGTNLVVRSVSGASVTSITELTFDTRFDRPTWPVPTKIIDCTKPP